MPPVREMSTLSNLSDLVAGRFRQFNPLISCRQLRLRGVSKKERLTGSPACAGIDPTGLLLPDVVPLVPKRVAAAGHQAALWLGGLSRIFRSTLYRWMTSQQQQASTPIRA